jgi:hypothetical protein
MKGRTLVALEGVVVLGVRRLLTPIIDLRALEGAVLVGIVLRGEKG